MVSRSISDLFLQTRKTTESLCNGLEIEDYGIQAIPDVSPTKWHLAHTSWFFDRFILQKWMPIQTPELFDYLFNSYYETVGEFFPRPFRGNLSRPTVREIYSYRNEITEKILHLLNKTLDTPLVQLTNLGIQHEMQHQELLLTDILYNFGVNPLRPKRFNPPFKRTPTQRVPFKWIEMKEGMTEIGSSVDGFDHERPKHLVYLSPYKIANRLTTWEEYVEFINDDGYHRPEFWLSEGWKRVQENHWEGPLYFDTSGHFTLFGTLPIDPLEPVSHVSYYEADAYAKWRNKRLLTEEEWENAAKNSPIHGNFLEDEKFQPLPADSSLAESKEESLLQLFGDVWEWTSSSFSPYPGFAPLAGSLGEYNGKFMCNQYVLRGGSFASSKWQILPTSRNFFPPESRWQFTGIRLGSSL